MRPTRFPAPSIFVVGLVAALAAGCGGDDKPPEDLGAQSGDAAVSPYAGPLTLGAGTSIEWVGGPNDGGIIDAPITAAHFVDGKGTITFDGMDLPAIVYKKIPFAPYTLGAIVAMMPTGLLVAYAYCQDGALSTFYSESLTESTYTQNALSTAGTCTFGDTPVDLQAAFIAPTAPLQYAGTSDIADVDGDRLHVHNGSGTVIYDGVTYELYVFTTVDCAKCGGAGWQELHATLSHDGALAFAIYYLDAGKMSTVQVAYGFRFDRPAVWPPDELIPATWTLK